MNNLAASIANLPGKHRDKLLEQLKKNEKPPAASNSAEKHSRKPAPLSYAQERLWFLNQLEPDSAFYNILTALKLSGPLDSLALQNSFEEIVRRHQSLRTVFPSLNGQAYQQMSGADKFRVEITDLSALPEHQREHETRRHIRAEEQKPFDLAEGPLIRVRLLRLGKNAQRGDSVHVLVFAVHHIVFDGWSIGILINEFIGLYEAFLAGKASPLPKLPIQYAEYAIGQRNRLQGPALEKHLAYWRAQLDDAPPLLELPTDRPRPPAQSHRGANHTFVLSKAVVGQLTQLSRRNGATLFMTLLAAFQVLLARYSGQQDICVGSPVANRTQSETEALIGFFVNTLVLRSDLSGNLRFTELLARVRRVCLDAQKHQDMPFEKLVEELRPLRDGRYSPLFQTMLVLQNAPSRRLEVAGLRLEMLDADTATAKFDLSFILEETSGGIDGTIEYACDLFDRTTIARLAEHYRILLSGIAAQPELRISELPLLSEQERRQILIDWNATRADYPSGNCIHQLFEKQAERNPVAVALIFENRTLSYGELNGKANRLAHYLRRHGVGPDVLVGLCVERSLEMIIGLLGILKAGGAYLPLDPDYPRERLGYMLADAEPALVLTLDSLIGRLPERTPRFCLDSGWPEIVNESLANPVNLSCPLNLVYVMYTSGSTGKPKGVAIPHQGLLNRLQWMQERFQLNHDDVILQKTPYSFDLSAWEFFSPLMAGIPLVIASPHAHKEPHHLASLIEKHGVTTIHFVPSMLQAFLDRPVTERCTSLKRIISGGEALSAELRQLFFKHLKAELHNLYGPTEATLDVTEWQCHENDTENQVSIGKPIKNNRLFIIDRYFNAVPVGVSGELCITGIQLAYGYLNRPELTAERFVPNPFAENPGERIYKTGDLARYRTDGSIEYLGRSDHQVKIRGFRIELGEIETQLLKHPGVREAVVIAHKHTNGDKRLVAYIAGTDTTPDTLALRNHLQNNLPAYMLPSAFVVLETFPLTANGKLDRNTLPYPDFGAQSTCRYTAPRNATEQQLAAIWADVLKVERVGIHDNFFELGGHSLLAVTLIERIRQAGWEIAIRDLFAAPTLAALAETVTGERLTSIPGNLIPAGCSAITPAMLPLIALSQADIDTIIRTVPGGAGNIQDIYPLAPLQEGILCHHHSNTEGDVFLQPNLLSFDSRKRLDDFLQALQAVIDRHDILRSAVVWEGLPEPAQVVWRQARLPVEELSFLPETSDVLEQLRARFDRRRYRLTLDQAPMMRGFVAHDPGRKRWRLLLLNHHLIMDHISLEVLLDELQLHLQGQSERLPPPQPFRNFVALSRSGASREDQLAFFRAMLGGIEQPTAPFGLLDIHGDGSGIEQAVLPLDAGLAERLRERARVLAVSTASLFHLAWALVVARLSGREDAVFGTVLFGRMHSGAGADRALGMFINTLPIRIRPDGRSVANAVRGAHNLLAELLRHEHAPLTLAQHCSGVAAPLPLFSALLNYRYGQPNPPVNAADNPAWEGIEAAINEERSNYPFVLSVNDFGDGFELTAQIKTPVKPQRICAYMHTALENLVSALETAPERSVRAIEILPGQEREQILADWNATCAEYPSDNCIHQLFEKQATRNPEAVALIFEDRTLSYGELNGKANQLAHYLRRHGVGLDVLVGLCVERSLEMIIGLLGILKAGGAYLPLDPDYPRERLGYMLADAKPKLVLTLDSLNGRLPERTPRFCLDSDWSEIANESPSNPVNRTCPLNLAYVIYTSGSTGTPKGVLIPHRGVIRLAKDTSHLNFNDEDTILQFAQMSFDASAFEIWGALLNGARLLIFSHFRKNVVETIEQAIRHQNVTALLLPTALFHQITDHNPIGLAGLRRLLVGGEALSITHLRKFRAALPDCELINEYGPTENSTISTYQILDGFDETSGSVPIGIPISNSTAYILDASMNMLPAGVAGELHVGGDGLARGYSNRPELTAERFVPHPFAETPGARLYKTGDLARYRADGHIEYLGRLDHQVKIRGFRIELGEIEARLSEHPAVRAAVVLPIDDGRGEKRLSAWFTSPISSRNDDLPASLRAFLNDRLPSYMIPASLVRLEQFPLNANGKLDRNALADIAPHHPNGNRYAAPRTDTEKRLAQIWAELLGVESVGIHDNFFELGGHSLMATRLLFKIKKSFDDRVNITGLFDNPVLEAQAKLLDSPNPLRTSYAAEPQKIDFVAEGILDASISPISPYAGNFTHPSAILLTGATGFLGAFLLYEYLKQTEGMIYCLVRASSADAASKRIRRTMRHYRLWDSAFIERIAPVCGDLSQPMLGLSEETWKFLAEEIDMICHNGAWVNFIQPYITLKPANVLGTRELLRLACRKKTKSFHYVSTGGIFGNDTSGQNSIYTETDSLSWNFPPRGGYSQSKKVAEDLVRNAGARGLPMAIYRPTLIVGDSTTGACNTDDFLFRSLSGYLLLGKAPKAEELLDLVTVDYVSRAIVWLSTRNESAGKTFHLANPVETASNALFEWTNYLGYRIETIAPADWQSELQPEIQHEETHPLYSLYSLSERSFQAGPDKALQNPRLDCRYTLNQLAGSGIVCPRITLALWEKYLTWLRQPEPALLQNELLASTDLTI